MKKINKKGIVKLIILVILLITQIKAFKDSRANKITYITANIIDASGLLSTETSSIIAMNEGESGMAITLPDILNTKKVTKYIVTKKTIIETIVEPEEQIESEQIKEITTEQEESEQIEETTTEPEEIEQIEETTTEQEESEQIEETTTEPETTTETIIEQVEKLPGEKVYLTQEEIENLEITLTVEYDTIEVNSEILYNKKLTVQDSDDYELLSVSGYMPYDTQIQSNEIDISNLENEIITKYPNSFLVGNYDISLISNQTEYIAKNYEQTLNLEMSIVDGSKTHYVLEVQEHTLQQLKDTKIENGKIKFTTGEVKTYLVLEMQKGSVTYAAGDEIDASEKIEINDFESDKNYYLGLNYTEGMSKTNSGKYTESNLKEVTINYYGYNYDIVESNVR